LPYFLRDNGAYVEAAMKENGYFTTYTSTLANVTPTTPLDLSNINSALSDIAIKYPEYFHNGYNGVFPAPIGEKYYMSASIESGKLFVNFAIDENRFDSGTSLVNALDKIKNGVVLSQHEEYSIEVLWHEILHLKSRNTVMLPPIDSVDGFTRASLETINQLVARKTYPKFLKQLGGDSLHQEWIINEGYGYSATVKNIRKLLGVLNIDNEKFYKKAGKLIMQDYTDFDKKIVNLMEKMSKKTNLMDIFGHIENKYFDMYLKNLE